MKNLKEKYQKEVLPKLKEEFAIKNNLAVPKLIKVVVNIGLGEAKDSQDLLDKASKDLALIAGQKPVVTKAKKSISVFKLSKGQSIGLMVTLRGKRMYQFIDRLVSSALPKVRDFRGLSPLSFDQTGNYTLGLKEQIIFPEISLQYNPLDKIRGLEISIITSPKDKAKSKRLLELLGLPFRKEARS